MVQKPKNVHAPGRKAVIARILIQCFIISALAILFIIFRRG